MIAAQAVAIERLTLALGIGLAEERDAAASQAAAASDLDDDDDDRGEYSFAAEPAVSETVAFARTLAQLDALQLRIRELVDANSRLHLLLTQLKPNENPQSLIDAILSRGRKLRDETVALIGDVPRAKYPFEHADRNATVSSFLSGGEVVPPREDPIALFHFVAAFVSHYFDLYGRMLSELVRRAEAVEERLGLAPLEAFVDPKPATGGVAGSASGKGQR
jgi:hypothetical protein